jgi:hypothetical protein
MKRWQIALLALLAFVVLTQAPFAYRRYRLGKLHQAIIAVQSGRVPSASDGFTDFRGVAHVHSFLGGHSSGTFQQIVSAAQTNQLHFVMMTEHPAREFNTAALTLQGEIGGVLFVSGSETRSANGDRLLLFPGAPEAARLGELTTEQILSRRSSALVFVAYPDEFKSWAATGYDGVEVYNVFTNSRRINPALMFFDALWSYRSYPDLLFARFYERPVSSLQKWDEAIVRHQKSVAIGGNDAHANVGLSLRDSAGEQIAGIQLDPYERSFRLVRLHVLIPEGQSLNEDALLTAIKNGNCFISYDLFGDPAGFRFRATDSDEQRIMGEEIRLTDEVRLRVTLPVTARIRLLKDGGVLKDDYYVDRLETGVREKGAYRVEIYLPQLPIVGQQPWIISNPIYVR